ncbi:malonyl-ACP O-methyltransferase BioC [Enterobacteriaceae bacterium H20N1]|uniref:Malonyl-[acyl-carrier protein] O-methyltransferase n=1 Tax=Dryocola boscaweniae TaxID=2925397 RepID=A0A9X2W8I3_9ENTR|nr:malonyl-ACP O-methyltransferase BioC [Dryocola boscaweniae]MCT4701249.1 malonyl-ACP O-methyltransferase BioC [Dryocola boscaweniae]MCT4718516.1 malonyl-ACP O-methyltransferase BioC [Dryocola boscaweniae]
MKPVNKLAVAQAFGRAANTYDDFSELQRISGNQLISRLARREFAQVLDAGCGTGWFSRYWKAQGCHVTALDLSAKMLNHARGQRAANSYLEGDIEALPLPNEQVSLAWSNLAVQWCGDLRKGLSELYRVTRPGGCVAFTTIAAGSLPELHAAWQAVDKRAHANNFLSLNEIETACDGWRISLHAGQVTQSFPDVMSAMRTLKGVGATHLHEGRKSSLMTRQQLQRLSLAWPQRDGKFPLSWQLVSGVIERD